MTSEMLSVFATHSMLGSPEALRYTEQLCAQVAALPEGLPCPVLPIRLWLTYPWATGPEPDAP